MANLLTPNPQEVEFLNTFFDKLRVDIIALQTQKGIKASGISAEELAVEHPDDLTWQLLDPEGYFEYQEYGRGPTTRSGGGGGGSSLRQRIYDWLAFKKYGFNWATEKQRQSMSWAIATNIHKKGSLTFRIDKQTGVLTEVLNEARMSELSAVLARFAAEEILSDVVKEFKA